MADIKISELSAALTVGDSDVLPMTASGTTVKVSTALLKEHAIGDNNISALGDGSVTGAILNVKSTSETADSNIAETMAQNGAHNLLPNEAVSQTANGITFIVSTDGSITVSGTASADTWYRVAANDIFSGDLILSGTPNSIGGTSVFWCIYEESSGTVLASDQGSGATFTGDGSTLCGASIVIRDGATISTPVVFKPMVRLASDPSTAYTPYAPTNGELMEKMIPRQGNDTLKEARVFNVTIPALDMGDTGAVKNFLADYMGHNYLGTNIISLRSNSNGQRATFIISNSDEYSMAIMVSFYSRYMGGVMGDAAMAAFWRYGNDWYYAPVNASWTQL